MYKIVGIFQLAFSGSTLRALQSALGELRIGKIRKWPNDPSLIDTETNIYKKCVIQ